jgi:hypothetical protein
LERIEVFQMIELDSFAKSTYRKTRFMTVRPLQVLKIYKDKAYETKALITVSHQKKLRN